MEEIHAHRVSKNANATQTFRILSGRRPHLFLRSADAINDRPMSASMHGIRYKLRTLIQSLELNASLLFDFQSCDAMPYSKSGKSLRVQPLSRFWVRGATPNVAGLSIPVHPKSRSDCLEQLSVLRK
mmetsp:Transcript_24364/g.57355  ORF Transcript_24364/g.57355 Transcript_24364/m.57355 type:complete len:127 (+) Transcript_24364:91-471(+)